MKIELPTVVIEELKKYCEKNELGLAAVGGNDFYLVIMGGKQRHINEIALMCAHALIEGVLADGWDTIETPPVIASEPARPQ